VFDVTEVLSENPNKPETFQRRTLKRLKALTLRKITGQRREDQPKIIGTPTDHVRSYAWKGVEINVLVPHGSRSSGFLVQLYVG
jgi:hypothetical protein